MGESAHRLLDLLPDMGEYMMSVGEGEVGG